MKKLPFEEFTRQVLTRKEQESNSDKGQHPSKRSASQQVTYGIVNIDKPRGPTSHQVSDFVQKILHITKAGHSGTLDPNVTGCLPIALGKGTRVVQALLKAGKEYVGVMHLHQEVEETELRRVISSFIGTIDQIPPIKSSVKRQLRQRKVYYFDILDIQEKDVLFRVGCEAGTYIRKLCSDVGQKLGCGAHMAELRRTQAGPFKENTLVTLQDLKDAFYYYTQEKNDKELKKIIQPLETGVEHLAKVWVFDQTIPSVCHGIDVKVPGISKLHDNIKIGEMVAIMSLKDELIAFGTAKMESKNMVKEKGVAVQTDKVFMDGSLYAIESH